MQVGFRHKQILSEAAIPFITGNLQAVTEEQIAFQAMPAGMAGDVAIDCHTVTHLYPVGFIDRHNHTGIFMPRHSSLAVFHQGVLICPANARSLDLDHYFCTTWFRRGHFIQRNITIAQEMDS